MFSNIHFVSFHLSDVKSTNSGEKRTERRMLLVLNVTEELDSSTCCLATAGCQHPLRCVRNMMNKTRLCGQSKCWAEAKGEEEGRKEEAQRGGRTQERRGGGGGEEEDWRNEKASTFLFFLRLSHKRFQTEWRFHGDHYGMPSQLPGEDEAEEEEEEEDEVEANGFFPAFPQ